MLGVPPLAILTDEHSRAIAEFVMASPVLHSLLELGAAVALAEHDAVGGVGQLHRRLEVVERLLEEKGAGRNVLVPPEERHGINDVEALHQRVELVVRGDVDFFAGRN